MKDLRIEHIGNRMICIGGVGKMFFQDGFPVSMAVDFLKKQGIDVSILHVVDECLKNGWSSETVIRRLSEDFGDDKSNSMDKGTIERFCEASYEDQREMIFQYLFGSSSKSAIDGLTKEGIEAKSMAAATILKEALKKSKND